jgi:DNA polymerase III gamma/tau subunit
VHANFLAYCRDALHLALGESAEGLALPADERARLAATAGDAGYENLLRLLHHLLGSETAIRRSEAGALALEIAWLRAAELPKLVAIEAVLGGISPATAGGRPTLAATGTPTAAPPPPRAAAPRPAAEPPTPTPPAPSAPVPQAATPPSAGGEVARLLEEVSRRKANLAGLLEGLATISWLPAERAVALEPHDRLAAESLARANNRELVQAAAESALGAGVTVRFLAARQVRPETPPAVAAAEARRAEARTHPRVQSVLSVFGGDVAEVSGSADEDKNR